MGYALRGSTLLADASYQAAIADLDVTLRLNPQYAWPLRTRAYAYARLADWDRAIADYDRLLKLQPDNIEHLSGRARAHAGKKDWDRARADHNRAIELDADYARDFSRSCFSSAAPGTFTALMAEILTTPRQGPLRDWSACDRDE